MEQSLLWTQNPAPVHLYTMLSSVSLRLRAVIILLVTSIVHGIEGANNAYRNPTNNQYDGDSPDQALQK